MHFITVSLAALTLGANVLAAPTNLFSKPGEVVSTIENDVSGVLNKVTKKDLDLFKSHLHAHVSLEDRDLVATVESVPVAGTVVSEVTTVASKLTPETVVSILGSAVGTLQNDLQGDMTTLTTLVSKDVTTGVVPEVHSTLSHMVLTLNSTVASVGPAVGGIVKGFSASEVEGLVSSITDMKTTVSSMETTLHSMVSTVEADAMATLKPEIAKLLSLVMPMVSPVIGFAMSVASTMEGDAKELVTAAQGLTSLAHDLLSPVTGLLAALL